MHRIEFRHRADPALEAVPQEVCEAGRPVQYAVFGPVPFGIEMLDRPPPLGLAIFEIVQQRIEPGRQDVPIVAEIPASIEIRVRQPMLAPAVAMEMHQRLDAGCPQIRVSPLEPSHVEQTRRSKDCDLFDVTRVWIVSHVVRCPDAAPSA